MKVRILFGPLKDVIGTVVSIHKDGKLSIDFKQGSNMTNVVLDRKMVKELK